MAFFRCTVVPESGGGGDYEVRYIKGVSSRSGSATTVNFDLSSYLSDYATLEVDNIICELTSTWGRSATSAQNIQITYSYNPSTGTFTATSNNTFGSSKIHIANFLIIKPGVSAIPTTTGIVESR